MRAMPDRYLQLDFQRRAPGPCNDCSDLRSERASRFTALHSLRRPAPAPGRRFLPKARDLAPLTSDASVPLARRRVNDAGLQCEPETPSIDDATGSPIPPPAATDDALDEPTNIHRLLQSTQSPSTLAKDRYPAPDRFSRQGVAPRRSTGGARNAPTVRIESQRHARRGRRLSVRNEHPCRKRRPRYTGV
jgi:hypothetical protein